MPAQDLKERLARFRVGEGEPPATLARALLKAERPKDALAVLADCLTRRPDDAELLVLEARTHAALGDTLTAEASLLKAARAAPDKAAAFRWLGKLFIERRDTRRAVKVLERAARLDPADEAITQLLEEARTGRSPPRPPDEPAQPADDGNNERRDPQRALTEAAERQRRLNPAEQRRLEKERAELEQAEERHREQTQRRAAKLAAQYDELRRLDAQLTQERRTLAREAEARDAAARAQSERLAQQEQALRRTETERREAMEAEQARLAEQREALAEQRRQLARQARAEADARERAHAEAEVERARQRAELERRERALSRERRAVSELSARRSTSDTDSSAREAAQREAVSAETARLAEERARLAEQDLRQQEHLREEADEREALYRRRESELAQRAALVADEEKRLAAERQELERLHRERLHKERAEADTLRAELAAERARAAEREAQLRAQADNQASLLERERAQLRRLRAAPEEASKQAAREIEAQRSEEPPLERERLDAPAEAAPPIPARGPDSEPAPPLATSTAASTAREEAIAARERRLAALEERLLERAAADTQLAALAQVTASRAEAAARAAERAARSAGRAGVEKKTNSTPHVLRTLSYGAVDAWALERAPAEARAAGREKTDREGRRQPPGANAPAAVSAEPAASDDPAAHVGAPVDVSVDVPALAPSARPTRRWIWGALVAVTVVGFVAWAAVDPASGPEGVGATPTQTAAVQADRPLLAAARTASEDTAAPLAPAPPQRDTASQDTASPRDTAPQDIASTATASRTHPPRGPVPAERAREAATRPRRAAGADRSRLPRRLSAGRPPRRPPTDRSPDQPTTDQPAATAVAHVESPARPPSADGDEPEPTAADELAGTRIVDASVARGDLDRARAALGQLSPSVRASTQGQMSAARLAIAEGRGEDAVSELRRAAEAADASAPLLALYGRALLAAGQVSGAARAYQASLRQDEAQPEAVMGRAEMAVRSRRAADALYLLDRLDRILTSVARPAWFRTQALLLRGRALLIARRRRDARSVLRDVVAQNAPPPHAYYFYARALGGFDPEAARDNYLRYLELAPEGFYARRTRRALGL